MTTKNKRLRKGPFFMPHTGQKMNSLKTHLLISSFLLSDLFTIINDLADYQI